MINSSIKNAAALPAGMCLQRHLPCKYTFPMKVGVSVNPLHNAQYAHGMLFCASHGFPMWR